MLSFEIILEGTDVERFIDLAVTSFAHVEERGGRTRTVNEIRKVEKICRKVFLEPRDGLCSPLVLVCRGDHNRRDE